jgi:hypothetical protein
VSLFNRKPGLTAQSFTTLTGLDSSYYGMVAPGRSWRARLRRWAWRKVWRMLRFTGRKGWARRRILLPWVIGAVAYLVAAIAHLVNHGWTSVLVFGGLGALPLYRWLGLPAARLTKRRGLKPVDQRIWYAAAYAALIAWTVGAAAWRLGPPMPGVWGALILTVWIRWVWHHRTRSAPVVKVSTGERQQKWSEIKKLSGTELLNITEMTAPKRWEADVDLTETDLLVGDVVTAVPFISKKYRVPTSNVIADYAPGRLEHVARLTIVEENPCDEPAVYDESWLPTAADIAQGLVPFHLFPNGSRARVRLWYPRAGTVNSLFSGDIGSGKSAGMEAKAIQAMWTGKVWVMAGDPQGGASLPALCGADGQAQWKAVGDEDNLDAIYHQLEFLQEAMYVRQEAMGRLEWVDKFGDAVTGLAAWDPEITGWPAIGYTLDEVWRLMKIPEFAEILKELLKMQRKVGFYIDMATQYPAIDEFNNDMAIRQCLTAGNLLCYANTTGTVKQMILPPGLPAPDKIPSETVDGEHTKGMLIAASKAPRSSMPVYSRSVWAERNVYWAKRAAVKMPDLEPAIDKIRAKYQMTAAAVKTEPRRETVTVAAVPPVRPTQFDQIAAYLQTRPGHRARSGVIAHALGIPLPSVSTALGRAKRKNLVSKHNGVWSLETVDELVEVA